MSLYERNIWNLEVVSIHDSNVTSSEFEGICDYYDALEKNISKTYLYQDNGGA